MQTPSESITRKKIVWVDGGIGRVICSVPAIMELARNHEVNVVTPWPEVFSYNDAVNRVYPANHAYIWEDVVRDNDLVYPEPYHLPEYYRAEIHLITAFNLLINGVKEFRLPQIFISRAEQNMGRSFVDTRKQHFQRIVAFQPFSASYQADMDNDDTNRSIYLDMVKKILAAFPDVLFINFTTTKIDAPNIVSQPFATRDLMVVANAVDACIGVDSCLCHIAAALRKPGLFFYGGTSPQQLGYQPFDNIQQEGYPQSIQSFRLPHHVNKNRRAMIYTDTAINIVLERIDNLIRNSTNDATEMHCSSSN